MRAFQSRSILGVSLTLALLAGASGARGAGAESSDPAAVTSSAAPVGFRARGPLHRVLVRADDPAIGRLMEADALLSMEDYGSFALLVVDQRRLRALGGLDRLGLDVVDELTLVSANGYVLDGADPRATAATLATIPEGLRAPRTPPADFDARLRIVQFIGPVKDDWRAELEATGAFVVTYLANDAYVVKAGPIANAAVNALATRPFVLAVFDYEPAFKLRAELRPPEIVDTQAYPVTVQVIADAEGEAFAASLGSRALATRGAPNPVLAYWNVQLELDGANVVELARDPRVFAIEPIYPAARLADERQDQIVAGNLDASGAQAANAAYLTWLTSKGFPGTKPFGFAVDVTDDGVDRGSTTDVNVEFRVDGTSAGASRVAYNNNYSGDASADGRAGHGNINASIIGGYNAGTGAAYEDAAAYNYGLGVAPWVKIGNTKVFSNSGAGVFNQPANVRLAAAYNGGARISSNSWGYTSGTNYDTDSQLHDQLTRDAVSGTAGHQPMVIVFAAGNDGPTASTIHPPGTAKNVITAGASENWRPTGTDGCGFGNTAADSAKDLASFSSRGPTSDARKKPEICAPGSHVQGAASRATGYDGTGVCDRYFPAGQTLYAWSSGTSHSTPAVAGAAALVLQSASNSTRPYPSPAMVKATLVSSASYLSGSGANDTLFSNNQGMGRVNLGTAFDSAARIQVDQTQILAATGATYTATGNVSDASKPFRVTLAWTDAPGATTGNAYVNNLDLEVTVNGTLYRGNVFSGANSTTGGTADARDNLESVFLPAGTTGSFSVVVRATNIAGDGVPGNGDTTDQDFALVIYNGATAAPTPNFVLSATPAASTITAGGSTTYTISSTPSGGFVGNVTLAAAPAIAGVTYSFTPNPIGPNGNATLTVTTTAGATTGTQNVTITGTSGALSRTANVSLTINPVAGGNPVKTFSIAPATAIPDNNATGITSTINVGNSLTVSSIAVSPNITHTYQGDLVVTLIGPDNTSVILHNRTGGAADNVITTYAIATTPNQSLSAFTGKNTAGAWKLKVVDAAAQDTGTLNSWTITFNGESSASLNVAIPDNNTTGVTSTLNVVPTGTVASVKVRVNVTHTYQGDLEVSLIAPDNTTVILHNRTGTSTDNIQTEYPDLTAPNQSLSAFVGKSINGAWKLKVRDLAAQDTGTLVSWTLSLAAQ